MIRFGEEAYPPLLMQIYDPPPVLITLGFPHVWRKRHTLAIVGARNASANGYQFAKKLAADAGSRGATVVSGLARGIDTAAHAGSLATGTIAVMASGIDHVYPPENKALYDSIARQGAVVTEQPFGMAPHARSFPGRNRIISGISQGIVVVEASFKSGSLITARFALDQDRDVFAVPGSPMDPRCRGTNGLITQGAAMCESIEDVMTVLNREPPLFMGEREGDAYEKPRVTQPQESELAEARRLVHSKLGFAPVAVDELLQQSHLSSNLLSLILLELELAGRLNRHTGHKVSLKAEEQEQLA
jgi:DNA processing protein